MLKKTIIFYLFLCAISNVLQAQNFRNYMIIADSLIKAENYQQAAINYEAGFKLQEGVPYFYNKAAIASAQIGDKEQAINYLFKSIEKGQDNVERIREEKAFISLQKDARWFEILSQIEANFTKNKASQNVELTKRLEAIYEKDQTFRGQNNCLRNQLTEVQNDYLDQLMAQEDSVNLTAIVSIIEEHGWLGKDEVGDLGNMTLWLVIQHGNLAVQEKYLPLLRKSFFEGKSKGEHLALLTDRILLYKGEPQLYGTQLVNDEVTKKKKVYPIANPEEVNKRRKEMGMESLDSYLQQWGIKY